MNQTTIQQTGAEAGDVLDPMSRGKFGATAAAIQEHYDVSNEFYELWLDPTMTYSCALWEDGDSLEQAQLRKIDYHIGQAGAAGAARVLDIGCGWGSTADRLVHHFKVERVVGLTLSQAQATWASRISNDHVEIRLESWADHAPDAPYDAMISIGAFEHFAKVGISKSDKMRAYRQFFQWCHRNLSTSGRLALQTIIYENFDPSVGNPFVSEIFPESDLPCLSEIVAACEGLFEVVQLRNDRTHYAKTLKAWYRSLRSSRAAIIDRFGHDLFSKYEKYLGVFVIGFHTGTVNLSRLAFKKIDSPVGVVRF